MFSFTKFQKAIADKDYEGDFEGIPVIRYEAVTSWRSGETRPENIHTEFDNNGNAYTSFFVSSEIVKWNVKTLEFWNDVPTYYSVGHLSVMGYPPPSLMARHMVAYNKITKDRYLPTGPELAQSAQLYDISGDKMQLLLDLPTVGEPHYAEALPASLIKDKSLKIYKMEENKHPYILLGRQKPKWNAKGTKYTCT